LREHYICLLWDGDLPDKFDHITTGVIHKKIAPSWAEAKEVAACLHKQ
jgi:hypothetical protein